MKANDTLIEHTLNYNVLTTYALSAIQGLTLRNEEQVARFETLTREIEDLRSEIQKIATSGAN